MPVKCGKTDSKGTYCQWGDSGKKYYYTPGDKSSREKARKKAAAQGVAAYASGYGKNLNIDYRVTDKFELLKILKEK